MNEDYLWDRTGKANEEIEELEQLLGKFKYQPRQLEIPAAIVGHKSFSVRLLAIAATIAILLIGAGVWRSLQNSSRLQATNTPIISPPDNSVNSETASVPAPPQEKAVPVSTEIATSKNSNRAGEFLRPRVKRERLATHAEPALPADEVAEAKAAKEQLMLALRVVSAKLTDAQKRTQGANPVNQIQNQHKIG